MTVILKVNPIQTIQGLSKAQSSESATKKTYIGVREMKIGKIV